MRSAGPTFISAGVVCVAFTMLLRLSAAQQPSAPEDSLARGAELFARSCSSCHGQDGAGGRASALAGSRRIQSLADADIQSAIRNGTAAGMPPFPALTQTELESVAAFVRSLNMPGAAGSVAGGDAAAGQRFFFGAGKCASCHLSNGSGAAIGPDLSNVGRRMTADELRQALLQPAATIAQGYTMATATLNDGRTIRGFVRNEGNHVLPLQDQTGRLVAIDKRNATITREPGTIMPPVNATPQQQLDLIAFLAAGPAATATTGAAPIAPIAPSHPSHPATRSKKFFTPGPETGRPITGGSTATGTAGTRRSIAAT